MNETEVDTRANRNFKQTLTERAQREPAFARTLLDDAASLFLNGDPATARPSKSLHRMLSIADNPSMGNLADIFDVLRRNLRVDIQVRAA